MATMINLHSKSCVQGDPLPPPVDPKNVRIFSMRFCPFAERTLLAASVKNIPCEVVNVSFKSKPDWFLQRSPFGTTPAVEYDGMVVFDSCIAVEWLDKRFPDHQPRFVLDDADEMAKQRMTVERLNKLSKWAVMVHGSADQHDQAIADLKEVILLADAMLDGDYFGGDKIGWADIILWPYLERLPVIDQLKPDKKMVEAIDACPKLSAYRKRMLEHPAIKPIARDPVVSAGFLNGYLSGNPDYDYGL